MDKVYRSKNIKIVNRFEETIDEGLVLDNRNIGKSKYIILEDEMEEL